MATRAGVAEYSTSPSAQRSSERSIRASWTTGYWGADASIRASISTRLVTTAATIPRASSPAPASASTSARSRSRTVVAVRCPKSASKTAASATRRPARRDRSRSPGWSSRALMPPAGRSDAKRASRADAVDQDADLPDVEPEQALDRAPDGIADARSRRDQVGTGTDDDPQLHGHAFCAHQNHDRRPRERSPPPRSAAGNLEDVRHLEGRETCDL